MIRFTFGTADATGGARPDAAARRGAAREATRARSAMRARDAMPAPEDARAATHEDTVIVVVDARGCGRAGESYEGTSKSEVNASKQRRSVLSVCPYGKS